MKKINRSAASILAVLMATIQGCSTTGVQESAGEYALDAWITARVKTLLSEDAQIRATEINIETSKGVVLLTGFINSEWAMVQAVRDAQTISGVISVKNDMRLK